MWLQILIVIVTSLIIGYSSELFYRLFKYKKIIWPKLVSVWMYVFIGFILLCLSLMQASLWQVIISTLVSATLVEYLTGYLYLKFTGVRLWNYSEYKYNYQGIICLRFSFYWLMIGLLYYYLWLSVIINI